MDSSDAENDTQPTALRRNLLKLTAGVGATAVVGSSSVTGYSHDDNDSVNVDYTPSTGSVSFASPEDGATEQNPVTFEMEATDFTIEPASSGVSDGAGHFHILVDQESLPAGEVIPNNEENGYYHYGGGQKTAELDLDPGEHTVRLQAGDANHRAYELTDTVSVTADGSTSSEQSTFTMDNVGSSAWEVSSADEEYVETSGGENPTITLETGVRYTISNEGWSIHPLAFRDESGSILLSQSSEGEFENDGDVNWSDSGSTLSFTLTDELADRINSYICTVHSRMVGQIETTESNTVNLNSVNIEPKEIPHPSGGEHTLTFAVENLSADGGRDEFDIAMPNNVEVSSVNIVSITGLESMPDPVASNPIEFSVDPSAGDISSSPVEFEVELDLSVNE